jgi:hypothetical protein
MKLSQTAFSEHVAAFIICAVAGTAAKNPNQ